MKHKLSKRSTANKHPSLNIPSQTQTRRLSNVSIGAIDARRTSINKIDPATETHFDFNTSCFKANLLLRSHKILKRDLLRCSDQRPSLLSAQTLPTLHTHHALASSSTPPSTNHRPAVRRRSISVDSHLFPSTNDPLGPWPDIPISRSTFDGNDSPHPIKNSRTLKHPRVFSPKYCTSLTDNTKKFEYHPSTQTYIDEYRKQKGYLLGALVTSKMIPRFIPIQRSQPELLATEDTYSSGGEFTSDTIPDRMVASTNDFSSRQNALLKSTNGFLDHLNISRSIPALAKIFNESHHMNNLPTIALRHGHPRPTRHSNHHATNTQHSQQQLSILPPLTGPSFQYISSLNAADKVYPNSKKPSLQNHSKFFLVDGRNKRKIPQRIQSDSGVTIRSQDYSELRATGGPVVRTSQRTTAIVVYQLPRSQPSIVSSQSDVG